MIDDAASAAPESRARPGSDANRIAGELGRRASLRSSLKQAARAAAALWILPRLLAYRLLARFTDRERAFAAASESLARIPGHRGVYCRQAFYRRTLSRCGRDVYFGWMSTFSKAGATVGDRAYIGRQCSVGLADLGADAMLADGVQVLSGRRQHGLAATPDGTHRDLPQTFERVAVGRGAWIGARSVVMADVGEGAVVGAGAVVVGRVPHHTVVAGVPAKRVRELAPPPSRLPTGRK